MAQNRCTLLVIGTRMISFVLCISLSANLFGCTVLGAVAGAALDERNSRPADVPYTETISLGDAIRVQTTDNTLLSGKVTVLPDFNNPDDIMVLSSGTGRVHWSAKQVESDTITVEQIASIQRGHGRGSYSVALTILGLLIDVVIVSAALNSIGDALGP